MNDEQNTTHLPLGTQLGEYKIEEVLGQGGFGITYKAWDSTLECYVAIKEYFPRHLANRSNDSISIVPVSAEDKNAFMRGLESFAEEAKTLAQFQHPGVVPVKRLVMSNSTGYMIMGFVEGLTLSEILQQSQGEISPEALSKWTSELLDALERVHNANLLHRDIKPGNVYIGSDGQAMLLDFGAARRVTAEASRSITGVVSKGYSPTEQYTESTRNQGPWTDIYSLSATLYSVVTGSKPIESTERRDEIDNAGEDPLELITPAMYSSYPAGLINAIMAGLAVLPRQRPQSVAEFRRILINNSSSNNLFSAPSGGENAPENSLGLPDIEELKRMMSSAQPTSQPSFSPRSNTKTKGNKRVHNTAQNEAKRTTRKASDVLGAAASSDALNTRKSGEAIGSSQLGESRKGSSSSSVVNSKLSYIIIAAIIGLIIALIFVGNRNTVVTPATMPVFLTIDPSSAVASVTINGVTIADWAKSSGLELEPGRHTLEVSANSPYSGFTDEILVSEAKRNNFSWTLSSSLVAFYLTVEPASARIILPDLPADVTYYPGIELEPKVHRVRVVAAGYTTATYNVDLTEGGTWQVDMTKATPISSINAQMVAIPAGSFNMGGTKYTDEGPVHRVNVPAFEIQKTEVNWEQYRECVNANGCTAPAGSYSFGDDEPVRNVSWDDAQRFISWLNRQTGSSYRLPSEAEWEYAARAGSSARYSSGNTLYCDDARYGQVESGACYSGGSGPVDVGSYRANSFGLYDMAGNVNEWVEDCFYNDYNGAPDDGSAWVRKTDCRIRSVRGGGWAGSLDTVATPYRNNDPRDFSAPDLGFRLARSR